ncbi:hypothetical protein FLLO111716_00105 [Flavobacterium longum]|uniref:WG repeat-containing protein n=1 Tax=Flavobacterium longum TaxID=1299340 RepID=UPI0039E75DD2
MKYVLLLLALLFTFNTSHAQKTKSKKTVSKTAPVKKHLPKPKKTINILVPYRVKDRWGFSDTLGNIKVQPVYRQLVKAYYYDGGKANFVLKGETGWIAVNQNHQVLVSETASAQYDSIAIDSYWEDYVYLHKDGKIGVNYKGKEIFKPVYRSIRPEPNESFIVYNDNGLVGLVNNTGKVIVPTEFAEIDIIWEESTKTKIVWLAKIRDVEKKFTDVKVPDSDDFDQIIYEKRLADEEKIADASIPERIGSQYDAVKADPHYAIYYVKKNGLSGVYDGLADKETIAPQYESISLASIERDVKIFGVRLNGKLGMVKSDNAIVVPIAFDNIVPDKNLGGFILQQNGKKGFYVRNTSYPYIRPKYNSITERIQIPVKSSWSFGLFKVTTDSGEGFVGENGIEFFKE